MKVTRMNINIPSIHFLFSLRTNSAFCGTLKLIGEELSETYFQGFVLEFKIRVRFKEISVVVESGQGWQQIITLWLFEKHVNLRWDFESLTETAAHTHTHSETYDFSTWTLIGMPKIPTLCFFNFPSRYITSTITYTHTHTHTSTCQSWAGMSWMTISRLIPYSWCINATHTHTHAHTHTRSHGRSCAWMYRSSENKEKRSFRMVVMQGKCLFRFVCAMYLCTCACVCASCVWEG